MEQLIELIRQYRQSTSSEERERLGIEIYGQIRPQLYAYIRARCPQEHVDDVCQEALLAIFKSLDRFHGGASEQFWSWCYSLVRNKIADHYRKVEMEKKQGELIHLAPEDLWKAIEESAVEDPLTNEQWEELKETLALLQAARPECYEYLVKVYTFQESIATLAQKLGLTYDAMRMRVKRCLEAARELMAGT